MTNEELNDIIDLLGVTEINFTTVGSTSVIGAIESLAHTFTSIVDIPVEINHSGHDGSGDAFRNTGIHDNPSMLIGYQSREYKEDE
jgi:hypothetical protein